MPMNNMWFVKKICSIGRNNLPKSKLQEYVTIEGNKILCCKRCSTCISKLKKKINGGRKI